MKKTLSLPGGPLLVFGACFLTALLLGCSPVSLLTTTTPKMTNYYGSYVLPSKLINVMVPYSIEYEYRYKNTVKDLKKPGAHFARRPFSTKVKVAVSSEVTVTYPVVADKDTLYFLSSDNNRGFDSFGVEFDGSGNHIIKSINSSFTPIGPEIATTSIKVLTTIIPAVVGAIAVPKTTLVNVPDSIVKEVQLQPVRKSIDPKKVAKQIVDAGADGYVILKFDENDLKLNQGFKTPVPKVEINVKGNYSGSTDAGNKTLLEAEIKKKLFSEKEVPGIIYRMPFFCDISAHVTHAGTTQAYEVTTQLGRESFPQLGARAIAPVTYSRNRGKQTIAAEFNVANGGLIKYSVIKEKSGATTAVDAGNLLKATLEAQSAAKAKNPELDQLKTENAIMDEKLKRAENKKKLAAAEQAAP